MRDAQFESLRLELLQRGVTPVYVERTILELREHYDDLESAARASGLSAEEATRTARATLGDERVIAAAVLAHSELLTFSTRWPRIAYCLHSAATVPGLPLLYCIEHRPELARWGVAFGAATTLMGSVLAALNWLIVLV
ncbi:MAG TPA: hypothetical protein VM692_15740 [Gammaproteobacteria bacterium]|nr:hypothetical protein [Gammaproteobacteria bacterium]